MHKVLRADELGRMICEYLRPTFPQARLASSLSSAPALVAFARTCKALSSIALDVLWREVKLEAFYCVFPSDMILTAARGQKSFVRPPLTLHDWSRFSLYASRVRKLYILTIEGFEPKSILAILGLYHHHHHPFPSLTFLSWEGPVQQFSLVTVFHCPTLVVLQLRPSGSISAHPDVYGQETIANVFRWLGERESHLKRLEFLWLSEDGMPARIEKPLGALLHQSVLLVNVRITPTLDILHVLSRLPSLRTLVLDDITVRDEEPDDHDQWPHVGPAFSALERLDISTTWSLSSIMQLLRDVPCFPRRELNVECGRIPAAHEFAVFLHVMIHPHVCAGLHHFTLQMNDIRDDDEWHPGETYDITLDTLLPLLTFRHLETFWINPGFFLRLVDSDLEEMASAWPELTSLNLGTFIPCHEDWPSLKPLITLRGLEYLAVMPRLESVGITLSPPGSLLSSLSPSRASSSGLTGIAFGPGVQFDSAVEMALFLVQQFPKLETIEWVVTYDDRDDMAQKWEEVEKGLQGAKMALHGSVDLQIDL